MNIKTSLCAAAFSASLCIPQIAYSENIRGTFWDMEKLKSMCVISAGYPLTDKLGVFLITIGRSHDGEWLFGTTDTYLAASGLGNGQRIKQHIFFSDGEKYFLDMRLQDGTLTSYVEDNFIESLRHSARVEIFLNNTLVADLPLDDSLVAIDGLIQCSGSLAESP